ncbi:MAG: hypothetical protein DRP15_00845 [Candidatus Aenigmatarchaeota archaeon]|nr:MAG: hypothetical protein DRP15_00845 [Candidatus Aenigmarchaeota archaeon]
MAKISIVEDCLAPDKFIYLSYKGPDPWGVAKRISERIRPFFHVSASGTNNSRINWDVTGENISFFSTWWVKKDVSRFSTMRFYLKVIGSFSKATNEGEFTLQLDGNLETKFSGWGPVLKPMWLIYSYLFYNRVRRQALEKCRNILLAFRNELKEYFNLQITEVPRAYGTFG